ncbi:MAG: hypothetical protein KDN22_20415 [Verrucomicrobiae bacterium]|nr:hypothetical protein [Verrucomicrobiae bacterium]
MITILNYGTVRAQEALIPEERRIDWRLSGVPGGIPKREQIFTTLTDLDASGSTDVSGEIQNALRNCPNDQVVALPAGTYRIDKSISIPHRRILRGIRPGDVVLKGSAAPLVRFYQYQAWSEPRLLSKSAAKGDNVIELGTLPSDLGPGMQVQIQENNEPDVIMSGIESGGGPWAKGQWVTITSVNADGLCGIIPPLYSDYRTALNARIRYPFLSESPRQRNFTEYAGLENVTLLNEGASSSKIVEFGFAAYCWMKDVRTRNAGVCHVWMLDTMRCELRGCTFDGILPPITSSRGYGIQLGTPNSGQPSAKTTALLLEDNIFDGNRGQMVLGYGASGCVVGYNHFANARDEKAAIQKPDILFHSAFPIMNLIEGNSGTRGVVGDIFHGNAWHNTIFRNWFKGKEEGKTSALSSIELDMHHRYYNVLGNVLGYDGIVDDVAKLINPAGFSTYEDVAPTASPYGNHYKVFMLGYYGEGGGTSSYDVEVSDTLIRHGNYDYVTESTVWSDSISMRTLPASLYHTSRPEWFADGVPWPCIGPDVDGLTRSNGAKSRYESQRPTAPSRPVLD